MDHIEQQRAELEAHIAKLRKALSHWRTLELDYEGLKDEIEELPQEATKSDYHKVAQGFSPQKLNDKELDELFEPKKGNVRPPKQLVGILSNRLDYVRRNVSNVKSQIDVLKKQNEDMLANEPALEDAELPVTEIIEELDEDGNVVSSKVQSQGDSASKVIDILKQVEGETEKKPSTSITSEDMKSLTQTLDGSGDLALSTTTTQETSNNITDSLISVDDNDSEIISLNQDDTEEEAQMRQEMLQYGLEEVGNIVAELELEGEDFVSGDAEDLDQLSDDIEGDSDLSDLDQSSEDDDEDEDISGRARRAAHSAAYRKRMEDLQKRLGVSMENVGPSPAPNEVSEHIEFPSPDDAKQYIEQLPPDIRKRVERPTAKEAARSAAIAREEAAKVAVSEVKTGKKPRTGKKVSFASELDIASDGPKKGEGTKAAVTSENVVERDPSTAASIADVKKSTKVSRFKSSRNSQPSNPSILKATTPTAEGPSVSSEAPRPIRTHSDVLVERPASKKTPAAPEADDFDEELQQRQIAMEHHQLKNRLIHNKGGYVQGGELDNWGDEIVAPEVMDERTGQPKKVSRFKAARLKS